MRNALIISVDDMLDVVRYRTAFGVEIQTPAIDSLIARGVTFENAFTPVPLCSPARVATLTGRSPFSTDAHHNNDPHIHQVAPVEETIIGAAHEAGWFTATRGKVLHHQTVREHIREYLEPVLDAADWTKGYQSAGGALPGLLGDSPVPEAEFNDAMTAEWAAEFLEDPPEDKPFILAIGFSKPHLSWDVPKKYYELYDPGQIEVPEIEGLTFEELPEHFQNVLGFGPGTHNAVLNAGLWKEHVHGYLAAVSFADAQVGEVLEAMDRGRHWKDTSVILWSDHGYHLGDREVWRKFTLWEEAASVPLVFVDPDVGKAGTRVTTPASLLDIWPTLSALTGIPSPRQGDGLDLSPLMADPSAELPRSGVVTSAYGSVSLRTENWRYNLYNDGEEELFRVGDGQVYDRDLLDRASYSTRMEQLQNKLSKELRKLGVDLVPDGKRERGDGEDEVFIVVDDAMAIGGNGDDVYHVTERGRIIEWEDRGFDLLFVGVDDRYVVPDHVEAAVLTNASNGTLFGNGEDNLLRGNNLATALFGMQGHDTLRGDGRNDTLRGGGGKDRLLGEEHDDRLHGGRNADALFGGHGDDVLKGALGSDRLVGGPGYDRFDFDRLLDSRVGSRRDEIKDFEYGKDVVDLTDIDAVAGGRANEAFTWLARGRFTGEAGELRYHRKGDDLRLKGDVDGDGRADFAIHFDDLGTLWRSDILF